MYGLNWFIGIILLIAGLLVWLDALAKQLRRGRGDVFAAWNMIALGAGGLLLAALGLIAKLCGTPEATMAEVQYYLSNRFRWEVLASLRTLLGYCGGQTKNLVTGGAMLIILGGVVRRLHPSLVRRELPRRWSIFVHAIRYGVPVLSCAFLSDLLARLWLDLDDAHRYIASEGFFLTANPADLWHFHSLAIYILCLLVPYLVLKYWAMVSMIPENPKEQVRTGLITLAPALYFGYLLIRVLTPVLGVTLYSLLVSLLAALLMGCFDPNRGAKRKKKRGERYTARENEILNLMASDLTWSEQIDPAEARAMAKKMLENGDAEPAKDIYERLAARGQED